MALIDDLLSRVADVRLREELARAIGGLRSTREYGLVFGDGKRSADPVYPALRSIDAVRNGPAERPYHAVINGENRHVLQLLTSLCAGQVDCIYIDPPYNSGAKDWKYNNRYADDKDAGRHSTWLRFMHERLALAKLLLKPDGVLIVTIDKNEHYHLGVLLEQEFEQHDVTSVCVVHNPRGAQGDNFSHTNEFAVFVTPAGQKVIAERPLEAEAIAVTGAVSGASNGAGAGSLVTINAGGLKGRATTDGRGRFRMTAADDGEGDHLRNWGGESSRYDAANCFYPIYVKDGHVVGFGDDRTNDETCHPPHDEAMGDGVVAVWPINNAGEEKKWRYARQSVESIRHLLRVKHIDGVPQIMLKKTSGKHKTVWTGSRYDANTYGTQLVKKLTGEEFPYPKSVLAVRDALYAAVAHKPNALILDFFAGSGTTFHAACLLNEEDGGARRCVLVTNNEVSAADATRLRSAGHVPGDAEFERHGIFESVTLPRCKAVVLGRNAAGERIEGEILGRPLAQPFAENVEFFKVDYRDPDEVERVRDEIVGDDGGVATHPSTSSG